MITIYRLGKSQTLKLAARELAKYLTLITQEDCFKIQEKMEYEQELKGIWIGLDTQIGISFEVKNKELDDAIAIQINRGYGWISGTNERSLLIGVYRYLTELGCKWVRPRKEGEVLVHKKLVDMNVELKEVASYRHRGIVIEGANAYENVLDIIEWMPKLGYNSYFIQFMNAYSFFKQWYSHRENPLKDKEFFDDEMAEEFTEKLSKEIKKRGLILHTVGHGWTSECIGLPGRGWDAENYELTEEQKECVAQINGKRELFWNVPINTNLCYSSPRVQDKFTDSIIKYVQNNKMADMIHVWVADDFNNHCECDRCKELTPTDWYVQILNQLDEKLTKKGLNNKIVFLLYFELLWTPIKEKLNNPERFIMMFAPISRTFTKSFDESEKLEGTSARYPLNKISLPSALPEYLRFLREWQEIFEGDSFDFDYHLGRSHYGDAGYYEIARIISKDIKQLKEIGLNGLLSCQQQRTFFPTGLPSYVMGKTLWNRELDFEEIAIEYFEAAFGLGWEECKQYLMEVSDVFDMDYWHLTGGKKDIEFANKILKVNEVVEKYKVSVEEHQNHENIVERASWKYINYHLEYVKLFAGALSAKAGGEEQLANQKWTQFAKYINENEDELQPVLDVFRVLMIGRGINKFKREDY